MITDREFESISDLALKVYRGRRVLFIVPLEDEGIEQLAAINRTILYPEKSLSPIQKRRFCKELTLGIDRRLLVITRDPFILTDAFRSQVYKYVHQGLIPAAIQTFGAQPSRIAAHVLNLRRVMGDLSEGMLRGWLENPPEISELQEIVTQTGDGYFKSKLNDILTHQMKVIG